MTTIPRQTILPAVTQRRFYPPSSAPCTPPARFAMDNSGASTILLLPPPDADSTRPGRYTAMETSPRLDGRRPTQNDSTPAVSSPWLSPPPICRCHETREDKFHVRPTSDKDSPAPCRCRSAARGGAPTHTRAQPTPTPNTDGDDIYTKNQRRQLRRRQVEVKLSN